MRWLVIPLVCVLLAACTSGRVQPSMTRKDTFVWGLASAPKVLDPAMVRDGESSRVVRHIFEGLVGTRTGSPDIVPLLATGWQRSKDARTWQFTLRKGVTFHDGTAFDAEAVCFNFERWYNFRGAQQQPSAAYYWGMAFGGFRHNDQPDLHKSLYRGCDAGDHRVTIKLTKPTPSLLSVLSSEAFTMVSPAAVKAYGDQVEFRDKVQFFTGGIDTEHPIGTGPYKFVSWGRGDQIRLERFDGYQGDRPKIKNLVFRPVPDAARVQALKAGEIDGFDFADQADADALGREGFTVLKRDSVNVAYVGFNQQIPPMDNPKIRRAVTHALNPEKVINSLYPAGSKPATQWLYPGVPGYDPGYPGYTHDPQRARELIAGSGVKELTLDLWYPTNVTRPYLPDPSGVLKSFKADLEAVGFGVTVHPVDWSAGYTDRITNGAAQLYLLGWTPDTLDASDMLGNLFRRGDRRFGLSDPAIARALGRAATEPDDTRRADLYARADRLIMDDAAGFPYAHAATLLVLAPGITGLRPDPFNNEMFSSVQGR
jgi:peptide/nickel transport system substrate-binding protein